LFLILAGGVVYAAAPKGMLSTCQRLWRQAPRKYRPLSAEDAADSDGDDEGDDPTARRRMLELSNFSPRKRNQAHPSAGDQNSTDAHEAFGQS